MNAIKGSVIIVIGFGIPVGYHTYKENNKKN